MNHEKLKAQTQETTQMLVKDIAADYGIFEADAALEEALKKVLSPNEDPKRRSK